MNEEQKPYVIDLNGDQVFSADYVFQQMQAQGQRIDRANIKAAVAGVAAAISFMISICLLCS